MTFDATRWHRLEFEQTPIYIGKDNADWFVPNSAGDAVLKKNPSPIMNGGMDAQCFMERLPDSPTYDYKGRADILTLDSLKELWFHITNRCNLSCSHCLFASSCDAKGELPIEKIEQIADEAAALGCRLFALTGGEPFVHKDFEKIVRHLLAVDNSHVVVLTNGMGIAKCLKTNQWIQIDFIFKSAWMDFRKTMTAFGGTGHLINCKRRWRSLDMLEFPIPFPCV